MISDCMSIRNPCFQVSGCWRLCTYMKIEKLGKVCKIKCFQGLMLEGRSFAPIILHGQFDSSAYKIVTTIHTCDQSLKIQTLLSNMDRSMFLSLALASLLVGVVSAYDWNILNQLKGLGSSSSQNGVVSSGIKMDLKGYCESWRINVEVHNIRNFDVVPQECVSHIENYMTSSQYKDDVERAVDEVILDLGSMCCSKTKCDGMDAWIFDIDDTLLSTIPYHKKNGFFGGEKLNATKFEEWIRKRKAPSVPHMKKLYHAIREKGIKIFLISSRKEYLRSATVDNLIQAGYHGWSNLMLRGLEDEQKEVKQYKAEKRTWLMTLGYRVWGVMGDQWSSFAGCPLPKRTFKLPNSIYYVA